MDDDLEDGFMDGWEDEDSEDVDGRGRGRSVFWKLFIARCCAHVHRSLATTGCC